MQRFFSTRLVRFINSCVAYCSVSFIIIWLAPARRAKIQVRPSLTRKPRQAAATTASAEKESSIATASSHNCDTTSAGDNVTASSHDIDEVLPDNIITPSSSLGIVSPPPPPPQQKSNIACSQKLPDEGQIKVSAVSFTYIWVSWNLKVVLAQVWIFFVLHHNLLAFILGRSLKYTRCVVSVRCC